MQLKGVWLPIVTPFLDDEMRGVFATRAPRRPNAIGLSVVELTEVVGNELQIKNVDVVNETPLLDIKPYIPEVDAHQVARVGWLEQVQDTMKRRKSDSRFR